MKVLFDTNAYVAEALLGETAEQLIETTEHNRWRIYVSVYLLDEVERVIWEKLGFSRRLARLSRRRILRRATLIEPRASRHVVPSDPHDSPILRTALAAGADYLVTNDAHLLAMSPYESLQIISMAAYRQVLSEQGWLS